MATILPFPQTQRAVRRRRESMGAAGMLSMLLLERDGEPLPPNVQRFDQPQGTTLPEKDAALMLALFVWTQLPSAKKEQVKSLVRCMAYDRGAEPAAVQLNNLLNGRRP